MGYSMVLLRKPRVGLLLAVDGFSATAFTVLEFPASIPCLDHRALRNDWMQEIDMALGHSFTILSFVHDGLHDCA